MPGYMSGYMPGYMSGYMMFSAPSLHYWNLNKVTYTFGTVADWDLNLIR